VAQTLEELKAEGKTLEILDLFPTQGKWTEEAYLSLPETNRVIELSEGWLIITPSPTTQHQRILSKLFLLLGNHILLNNLGELVVAPMDIRLWQGLIRQPDIVFMNNEHRDRITEKYWGVPDLVMEITSESTEKQDRTEKFYEYGKAGVLEYWIVDPSAQTIEVFVLDHEAYKLLGKWGIGEVAYSKVLAGFEVEIDEIMK